MATTTEGRTIPASWVPVELAEQIRARAEDERRSVSAVIRSALEAALRRNGEPPATGRASR